MARTKQSARRNPTPAHNVSSPFAPPPPARPISAAATPPPQQPQEGPEPLSDDIVLERLLIYALTQPSMSGRLEQILLAPTGLPNAGNAARVLDLLDHVLRSTYGTPKTEYLLARTHLFQMQRQMRAAGQSDRLLELEQYALGNIFNIQQFALEHEVAALWIQSAPLRSVESYAEPEPVDYGGGGDELDEAPPDDVDVDEVLAEGTTLNNEAIGRGVQNERRLAEMQASVARPIGSSDADQVAQAAGALAQSDAADAAARAKRMGQPPVFWMWYVMDRLNYDRQRCADMMMQMIGWLSPLSNVKLEQQHTRRQLVATVLFVMYDPLFYALQKYVMQFGEEYAVRSIQNVLDETFLLPLLAEKHPDPDYTRPLVVQWSKRVEQHLHIKSALSRDLDPEDAARALREFLLQVVDFALAVGNYYPLANFPATRMVPGWITPGYSPVDSFERDRYFLLYATDVLWSNPNKPEDWLQWMVEIFRRSIFSRVGNTAIPLKDRQVQARNTLALIVAMMQSSLRGHNAILKLELDSIRDLSLELLAADNWESISLVARDRKNISTIVWSVRDYWLDASKSHAQLKQSLIGISTGKLWTQAPYLTLAAVYNFQYLENQVQLFNQLQRWIPEQRGAEQERVRQADERTQAFSVMDERLRRRQQPSFHEFSAGPFETDERRVILFVRGNDLQGAAAAVAAAEPEPVPSPSPLPPLETILPQSPHAFGAIPNVDPLEAGESLVGDITDIIKIFSNSDASLIDSFTDFKQFIEGGDLAGLFWGPPPAAEPPQFTDFGACFTPPPPQAPGAGARLTDVPPLLAAATGVQGRLPIIATGVAKAAMELVDRDMRHVLTGMGIYVPVRGSSALPISKTRGSGPLGCVDPEEQGRAPREALSYFSNAPDVPTPGNLPLEEQVIDGEWRYRAMAQSVELAYYAGHYQMLHTNAHIRIITVFAIENLFQAPKPRRQRRSPPHFYPIHGRYIQGAWASTWLYHDGQSALKPHPLQAVLRVRSDLVQVGGRELIGKQEGLMLVDANTLMKFRPQPCIFTEMMRQLSLLTPRLSVSDTIVVKPPNTEETVLFDRERFHRSLNSRDDAIEFQRSAHQVFSATARSLSRKIGKSGQQIGVAWGDKRPDGERRPRVLVVTRDVIPSGDQTVIHRGVTRGEQTILIILNTIHVEPLNIGGENAAATTRFIFFVAGNAVARNFSVRPSVAGTPHGERVNPQAGSREVLDALGRVLDDPFDQPQVPIQLVEPIFVRVGGAGPETSVNAYAKATPKIVPPADSDPRVRSEPTALSANQQRYLDETVLPAARKHLGTSSTKLRRQLEERRRNLIDQVIQSRSTGQAGRFMFYQHYRTDHSHRIGVCVNHADTYVSLNSQQAHPLTTPSMRIAGFLAEEQALSRTDAAATWGSSWVHPYDYWPALELPNAVAADCFIPGDIGETASDDLPDQITLQGATDAEPVYYLKQRLGYGVTCYIAQFLLPTWSWYFFLDRRFITASLPRLVGSGAASITVPPPPPQVPAPMVVVSEPSIEELATLAIGSPLRITHGVYQDLAQVRRFYDMATLAAFAGMEDAVSSIFTRSISEMARTLGVLLMLESSEFMMENQPAWFQEDMAWCNAQNGDFRPGVDQSSWQYRTLAQNKTAQLKDLQQRHLLERTELLPDTFDEFMRRVQATQPRSAPSIYGATPIQDVMQLAEAIITRDLTVSVRGQKAVSAELSAIIEVRACPWSFRRVVSTDLLNDLVRDAYADKPRNRATMALTLLESYKNALELGVERLTGSLSDPEMFASFVALAPYSHTLRSMEFFIREQRLFCLRHAQALWMVLEGVQVDATTGELRASPLGGQHHAQWPTLADSERSVVARVIQELVATQQTRFSVEMSKAERSIHVVATELYCRAHVHGDAGAVLSDTLPTLIRQPTRRTSEALVLDNTLLAENRPLPRPGIRDVYSLSDVLIAIDQLVDGVRAFIRRWLLTNTGVPAAVSSK